VCCCERGTVRSGSVKEGCCFLNERLSTEEDFGLGWLVGWLIACLISYLAEYIWKGNACIHKYVSTKEQEF